MTSLSVLEQPKVDIDIHYILEVDHKNLQKSIRKVETR